MVVQWYWLTNESLRYPRSVSSIGECPNAPSQVTPIFGMWGNSKDEFCLPSAIHTASSAAGKDVSTLISAIIITLTQSLHLPCTSYENPW
mmetsp:Transcript_21984/g.47769  ORF Transcript_21984/g.47769 Transcript_21984/m.47769 type:complete len:90 (-) Transcript_21984:2264-2533(-)